MQKKRIFVGPIEIAGFAHTYAKAFTQLGYKADFVTYNDHNFKYQYDKLINIYGLRWYCRYPKQILYFLIHLFKYDYFIFLFGMSLLPNNLDLPILKLFGKKTIMVYLGCDIRVKSLVPESTQQACGCINPALCLKESKEKKVRWVEKWINEIFAFEGYAQLLDRKYHTALVPIDTEEWKSVKRTQKSEKPVIIHAPSNADVKGTKYIEEAIDQLKKENYDFEFKIIKNISNQELKNILQNSDIVVDQILDGMYGRLAVESMSLGKIVVVRIDEKYEQLFPNMPVVNANPENIYEKLKELLEKPDNYSLLSQNSREYAIKYHDMKNIAIEMINLLS